MSGFTHDNVNNKSVDWYTPKWIFDEMGVQFGLDPCAPTGGVPWIPAWMSYDKDMNGLALPWFMNVWLNPPYGKHTGVWLKKMHEYRNGIALVFARTDCRWFHDYCVKADAILFVKRRIAFVDAMGTSNGNNSAGAGSILVAWGDDNVQALHRLADNGRGELWLLTLSSKVCKVRGQEVTK